MALSETRILDQALAILDEYGLADLTMRRIADALDVKAGALYWHFPNKQSLLAGLADRILQDLAPAGPPTPLDEALRDWADGLRQVLLAHRDAAELVASSMAMGLGAVDPSATARSALIATGMPMDEVDATAQAFVHFVLGHVVEEQTKSQLAALGLVPGQDDARTERHFARGVGLLVAGVHADACVNT